MSIFNPISSSLTPPAILLVEDNIIALKFVETIVAQAECRFISTTDGKQALDLAKSIPFQLIITDVSLPGISGIELAYLIREWEKKSKLRQVPIIGLTAHVLSESKNRCLQAGMNKVLSKPIYINEMQELILQYVNLKNA